MKNLGMAYKISKRNMMSKGGAVGCAHGGMAYCNAGCYDKGGEVSAKEEVRETQKPSSPQKEPEEFKNAGLMEPKSMASMIMKMAKGGMVNSEEAQEKAHMYEEGLAPEIDLMEENQDMPLDHASEEDDRLTPADKDSEWGKKKKGDLISRVMMSLK